MPLYIFHMPCIYCGWINPESKSSCVGCGNKWRRQGMVIGVLSFASVCIAALSILLLGKHAIDVSGQSPYGMACVECGRPATRRVAYQDGAALYYCDEHVGHAPSALSGRRTTSSLGSSFRQDMESPPLAAASVILMVPSVAILILSAQAFYWHCLSDASAGASSKPNPRPYTGAYIRPFGRAIATILCASVYAIFAWVASHVF